MGKNRKRPLALTIGVVMFLLGAITLFVGLVVMAGKEQEGYQAVGSPAWPAGEVRPDVRSALLEEQLKAVRKELEISRIRTAAAMERLEIERQSASPLRDKLNDFRVQNGELKDKLKALQKELGIARAKSAATVEQLKTVAKAAAAPTAEITRHRGTFGGWTRTSLLTSRVQRSLVTEQGPQGQSRSRTSASARRRVIFTAWSRLRGRQSPRPRSPFA